MTCIEILLNLPTGQAGTLPTLSHPLFLQRHTSIVIHTVIHTSITTMKLDLSGDHTHFTPTTMADIDQDLISFHLCPLFQFHKF